MVVVVMRARECQLAAWRLADDPRAPEKGSPRAAG